jgi:hypothetical protein
LDIDFLAGTTGNLDSESFGIDNILMTALGDCDPDSICVEEKVVIEDNFEGGLSEGWFNGKVDECPALSKFLGRFIKDDLNPYKTFTVPTDAQFLTLEFDFYEIDSWDKDNGEGPDCFYAYIDAVRRTKLDFGAFDSVDDEGLSTGETDGISWQRRSKARPAAVCFGAADSSFNDQIHHVKATIPKEFFKNGELYVEFYALLSGGLNDESAGVDNIKITAHYDCGCADEVVIINDDFSNGLSTGWVGGKIDNSTSDLFLGPFSPDVATSKVFTVSASDSISLQIDIYEIGVWGPNDSVEVTISGSVINFGVFGSSRSTGIAQFDISWEVVRSDAGKHKFTAHIPKYLYQKQKLVLLGLKVVSTDAYPQALVGYDNIKFIAQFDCNVGSCVELDFERKPDGTKLGAGAYIQNEWLNTYGLRIEATGGYSPSGKARIFDTSYPGTDHFTGDPDLGSPNEKCAGGGPGIGAGGEPGSPGENCEPLGNVLTIQESNKGTVDDNSAGGTISFNFGRPVKLEHIGLLDMGKNNFDYIEVYTWKGEHKIIDFQGQAQTL